MATTTVTNQPTVTNNSGVNSQGQADVGGDYANSKTNGKAGSNTQQEMRVYSDVSQMWNNPSFDFKSQLTTDLTADGCSDAQAAAKADAIAGAVSVRDMDSLKGMMESMDEDVNGDSASYAETTTGAWANDLTGPQTNSTETA